MIGRFAAPVAAGAVEIGAAVLALGRPNPSAALDFLGSSAPTMADSLAATQLLVWIVVAATAAVTAGSAVAGALSAARARRRLWEVSILALGLVLLAAGAARHLSAAPTFSGGTVQEARTALGP